MSIRCISDVWEYSNQKGNALLLMLALADYANDENESYPSKKTLARKIRSTEQTVDDLIKKLIHDGELIRIINAGVKTKTGATNRYRIVINKEGGKKTTPLRDVEITPPTPIKGGEKTPPKPSVKDIPSDDNLSSSKPLQEQKMQQPTPLYNSDFVTVREYLEQHFAMTFTGNVVQMIKDDIDTFGVAIVMKACETIREQGKRSVGYKYISTTASNKHKESLLAKEDEVKAQQKAQKEQSAREATLKTAINLYDKDID